MLEEAFWKIPRLFLIISFENGAFESETHLSWIIFKCLSTFLKPIYTKIWHIYFLKIKVLLTIKFSNEESNCFILIYLLNKINLKAKKLIWYRQNHILQKVWILHWFFFCLMLEILQEGEIKKFTYIQFIFKCQLKSFSLWILFQNLEQMKYILKFYNFVL